MSQHNPINNLSPVWTRATSIIAERGEGCYIYGEDGTQYLDFTCGIGVTNIGHCHPRVVEAIRRQAGLLLHGQANIVYHRPMIQLAEQLKEIFPSKLDGFFFSNSGAEAIEGAVKLARAATRRTNVIVSQGSFHGRTVGAMSLTTSKTIYRAGYQPLMPGVFVAPFPYHHRYGWDAEVTSQWCLDELRYLLQTQTAPFETAAILIEPVLGEGGYVVPPANFLPGLRDIAAEHGILLILDEVQSGFGRTGKWLAYEHFNITPDIVVIAKGMASGMPISGVVAPLEMMELWTPGSHGGTYGGNAMSAAAAVATIQAIREENMLENARLRGAELIEGLRQLGVKYPFISDVRGLGLMIGVEFRDADRQPDKTTAKKVIQACLKRKMLLLSCGPWDNTIRFIPPINIESGIVEKALKIFESSLADVYSV
ncbi:MAG: aminotransferase class III-fold pyridoxal phosphate-dependent enzyme [Anaerolineaceae bacterium]|nr:aminotransferase class III-fold pyridoxal phosphate-dependent enzyme [Anaerolineaceae bacterium]